MLDKVIRFLSGFLGLLLFINGWAAEEQSSQTSQALQQLQQLQQTKKNQASSSQAEQKISAPILSSEPASEPPPGMQGPTEESVVTGSPTDAFNATVNETAFNTVTSRLFPLTPEQIVELRSLYNTNELAKITTPDTPPRPTATSQFVNLAPGSTPPVIRLAQGFVSSLVFLDSTGAPWPITAYDLGDPKAFNIQWDKSGNTLMIQANQLYTYGNLAIRLQGLNTPVMMTLIPGQKAVDYRVDLRIQGYGPNALETPTGQSLPPSANSVLLSVLDGVPPPNSKLLDVIGGPAEAWAQGSKLFVRTRLTILSPGWISFMSSADGMSAYEMQATPVLLVSWQGKVIQLKIEGL